MYAFLLVNQLEYRFADGAPPDHLGWEAQGWIGGDYHRLWLKSEGETVIDGPGEGEGETDVLYSRLISPFWSAQVGIQYANEWSSGTYEDRWSAVLALLGLAPYKFELDGSVYLSTGGDLTLEIEAEYGVRVTQRLVLQPRTELAFAARDIPERRLGSGLTDAKQDLRLRYEVDRKLAPYLGVRWRFLVGETGDLAEASGGRAEQRYVVAGFRLAF